MRLYKLAVFERKSRSMFLTRTAKRVIGAKRQGLDINLAALNLPKRPLAQIHLSDEAPLISRLLEDGQGAS